MSEEASAPDLLECNRRAIEAVARRDFDAAVRPYAPEAVWDTSALGLGTYRGPDAIRHSFEEWLSMYEEFGVDIEEHHDFGNGVILSVTRQYGRVTGSTGRLEFRYASVTEWSDGMIERVTPFTDVADARAAAASRARARG